MDNGKVDATDVIDSLRRQLSDAQYKIAILEAQLKTGEGGTNGTQGIQELRSAPHAID